MRRQRRGRNSSASLAANFARVAEFGCRQHWPVKEAAETHRQSLKNPPKSIKEFLASLEAQGLPQSVAALRILFH
jgi:hypothetical protein